MQLFAEFKFSLVLVAFVASLSLSDRAHAGRILDHCKALLSGDGGDVVSLLNAPKPPKTRYEKIEQQIQKKIQKALVARHGKLSGPPITDIQEYFDLLVTSKVLWAGSRTTIKQMLDIIYDLAGKTEKQTPRITNLVRGLVRIYDTEFPTLLRADLISGYLYLASVGDLSFKSMQTVLEVFVDPMITPEHREYGATIFNFIKQNKLSKITEVAFALDEVVRRKSFDGHFDYQIRKLCS